jgi:O-antigen ligase
MSHAPGRGVRVKPSTWIAAPVIGLAVAITVATDTWIPLLAATCGIAFIAFGLAHPRPTLLVWLLFAPVLNVYARVALPVGLPDIIFGRVAIGLISVALAVRMVLQGRRLAAFGAVEVAMLAQLSIMALDLFTRSGNPASDGLQNFDERVTPVLLFLAARNLCIRRRDLADSLCLVAVLGCYLAVHGGYQYVVASTPAAKAAAADLTIHEGGMRVNESHLAEGRAVGPFTSAVEYGSVTAITFLAALFLFLYGKEPILRLLSAAALPLTGAGVIMSSTRSAWIGGFAAVLLMAMLDRRRRAVLLTGIAVVTVVGLVAAAVALPSETSNSLEDRALSMDPVKSRLVMYDVGFRIALRHPLIGYGRGAPSRIAARQEMFAQLSPNAELAPGQFHNVFLMSLVEWGVPGVLAYIAVLAFLVRAALQLRRQLATEQDFRYHFASLFLGATIIFVVQGLLTDTPPFLYLNGVYFFLAGLLCAQLDANVARPVEAVSTFRAFHLSAAREGRSCFKTA